MNTLPMWKSPSDATSESVAVQEFAPAGLRIMVVDDNIDSADVLGVFFLSSGYDVKVEYSALSVLRSIEEYRPHIVIIDIGLPDIDGCELVKQLRELNELSSTLFVAFSGYSDPESKAKATYAGFHQYVTKPSCISVFLDMIAQYQERHANRYRQP